MRWSCTIILTSVLCLTKDVLATGVCNSIQVLGAVFHNTSNRIYSLHNEIHCNSRPVWVDADQKHYVYYLLDGFDGWMISPTSCYLWGNFMISVKTDAETPYNVSEVWREYSPNESIWKDEVDLKVQCFNGGDATMTPLPSSIATSTISIEEKLCEFEMCSPGGVCVRNENNELYCKCKETYSGYKCTEKAAIRTTLVNWTSTAVIIGLSVPFIVCLLAFLIFIFRKPARTEDSPIQIFTSNRQLHKYFRTPASEDRPGDTVFKYRPLEDDDIIVK